MEKRREERRGKENVRSGRGERQREGAVDDGEGKNREITAHFTPQEEKTSQLLQQNTRGGPKGNGDESGRRTSSSSSAVAAAAAAQWQQSDAELKAAQQVWTHNWSKDRNGFEIRRVTKQV